MPLPGNPIIINVISSRCGQRWSVDQYETLLRDTDGDGVLDYLDGDSDNDGLTDAEEGGRRIGLRNSCGN